MVGIEFPRDAWEAVRPLDDVECGAVSNAVLDFVFGKMPLAHFDDEGLNAAAAAMLAAVYRANPEGPLPPTAEEERELFG